MSASEVAIQSEATDRREEGVSVRGDGGRARRGDVCHPAVHGIEAGRRAEPLPLGEVLVGLPHLLLWRREVPTGSFLEIAVQNIKIRFQIAEMH